MSKKLLISSFIFFVILAGILSYEIATLVIMSRDDEDVKEQLKSEAIIYEDDELANLNVVEESEVIPADTTQISRITPSTRVVYQYYYTLDDRLVTDECEPPYYLIDMTRQQLEIYYNDWQLISFSPEKVVLRQSISERDTKGYYIVQDYNDNIAVFFDYTKDFTAAFEAAIATGQYKENEGSYYFDEFMSLHQDQYLREIIDTPISVLPIQEQEKLKNGILVYGEEELIRLLEDYTS